MASLHVRESTGKYQVAFRYEGKLHSRCTGTTLKKDAQLIKRRIEDALWRLANTPLTFPQSVDPVEFIFSGAQSSKPVAEKPLTLGELFEKYRGALPEKAKEANTLYTERIHEKHLTGLLGTDSAVESLSIVTIQEKYVTPRSGKVAKSTIIKELKTLRHVWRWGVDFRALRSGPDWSITRLNFSKPAEKIPFRTYDLIKTLTDGGGKDSLWKGLYLIGPEIAALLDYVEGADVEAYPPIAFAALTGARKSELLRAEVGDVDFTRKEVTLHERKRVKGQASTRIVELHPRLGTALRKALEARKSGRLFPSVTTHNSHRLLKTALAGHEKFKQVRGWHVLRHSFISALAVAGVDPRIIQAMVGHTTPEMTEHYTHIGPKQTARAIDRLLPG